MRLLLPARDFLFSLLFVIFCVAGGVIAWDQRYNTPFEEQLPFIFFGAIFSWAALYMLGREIWQGPLVYRYAEQKTFEIPLQSVHEIRIGPLHKMEGCFLLVHMRFESPEDSANEMRSFRLYKPKKNSYDRIIGQAQIRGGHLTGEGDILNQAGIDWCLQADSENSTGGPDYDLDLLVPVKGHDSHYLSISPLKMKRTSSAIAKHVSQEGLSMEVTLRFGYGISHLRKRGCPSFEDARVYCEVNEEAGSEA